MSAKGLMVKFNDFKLAKEAWQMLFYTIIGLALTGLGLGSFIALQPHMLFLGGALVALGASLALLGFTTKKVADGLKAMMPGK